MLVYICFYYVFEHLGDWDHGNMKILKIGAKVTSGEPRICKFGLPEPGPDLGR